MTGRSDAERAALLRELYTGAVADILDDLGHREQCLPADIRPLSPEMKVAGPVYTVRGRARAYDDGTDPRFVQMDMLDGIFAGCVVVIDPGDEERAAHWGELMSHTARAKGATGVVVAGGVRDTPQILEVGFPAFAGTTRRSPRAGASISRISTCRSGSAGSRSHPAISSWATLTAS